MYIRAAQTHSTASVDISSHRLAAAIYARVIGRPAGFQTGTKIRIVQAAEAAIRGNNDIHFIPHHEPQSPPLRQSLFFPPAAERCAHIIFI